MKRVPLRDFISYCEYYRNFLIRERERERERKSGGERERRGVSETV